MPRKGGVQRAQKSLSTSTRTSGSWTLLNRLPQSFSSSSSFSSSASGFGVASIWRTGARNLSVNQDQQRSNTENENENDDEDERVLDPVNRLPQSFSSSSSFSSSASGFSMASIWRTGAKTRNLNVNQDQQRSNTEDENDDDDEDERESQKEKLSLPHVLKIGYIILMEPLFDYEKRVQTGKEMLARVV